MKCIGKRCPYCSDNEYYDSFYCCVLDGVSRKKDNITKCNCCIDEEFNALKVKLDRLREVTSIIFINQK